MRIVYYFYLQSPFYSQLIGLQDAVKQLSAELFSEHKQLKDEELKERLATKLQNDDRCAQQLQKLKEKGITFDMLWEDRIYSAVSI